MTQKVYIADDERLICQLLKHSIKWDELDLTLEGVFYDGQSLYQAILKDEPDIVITDISMPLINGIEMIRLVREAGCKCHFVIISGYKEFEYAHSALKYNVEDYLLKPVNAEELNKTLEKLCKRVNKTHLSNNKQMPQSLTLEEHPQYHRYIFQTLLHSNDLKDLTLEEITDRYHIDFQHGTFQCISIRLQNQSGDENGIPSLSEKIIRIMKEHIAPHCYHCITDYNNLWIYVLLNYDSNHKNAVYSAIEKAYSYGENIADIFLGVSICFGIGTAVTDLTLLSQSYIESALAVTSRLCVGNVTPLYWEQIKTLNDKWSSIDLSTLTQLKADINGLLLEEFDKDYELAVNNIENTINIENLDVFTQRLISYLTNVKEELLKSINIQDDVKKQFHLQIQNCQNVLQYLQILKTFIKNELKNLRTLTQDKYAHPVSQAIQYIESHYQESLGLEDVARFLNLNAVYLSSLFKKETKINFLEYLHNYRLNKAKGLLKDSSFNIAEVGNAVGYMDSRHFSKLFKKKYGLNPSDYRQMYS